MGGAEESRYLGYSIQKSYEQIDEPYEWRLLIEQNERRKSELDALQARLILIFFITRWILSRGMIEAWTQRRGGVL